VTVKFSRGTWNLRSQRCFEPIRDALAAVRKRPEMRVVHYSVQHDHVHMIVEADDRRSLVNGMKALLIRVARGINRVMGARGRRLADRYHEHVLKTPTETRNALRYVLKNRATHLARWGKAGEEETDSFSSLGEPLVKRPRSWLLREGWQRAGPLW
jgi:REP element-mobilizing transposase RayT